MLYNNIIGKQLQCSICGNVISIQRKKSKDKSIGHVKTLYCFRCKKDTAHIEKGIT